MLKNLFKTQVFQNELGVTLVAAAVIAFFVALVALTTLALTKAQIESVDDQTQVQQAKLVSEIGLENALLGLKLGNAEAIPKDYKGLADLSPQELKDFLRNPETGDGVVYGEDPDTTYYTARETLPKSSSKSIDFKTISGDSEQALITFVDDTTVVRDILEYDYQESANQEENWIYSLGEARKNESDARVSLSAKVFDQENTVFERRVVKTQGFNENHPDPPFIESKHNSYDPNQTRNWVVSYPTDSAHPNRSLLGIDLLFEKGDIGLGSAGDKLEFSAWNGMEFEPFFASISGPIYETTFKYETNSPFNTKALKISFTSDAIDDSANTNANFGFRVSGVKYTFDSDIIPALYETPHPYNALETNGSYIGYPELTQVVYSPYALPPTRVNPIKEPGNDIITPVETPWTKNEGFTSDEDINFGNLRLKDIGGNEFQVMRVHFDEFFSLEPGDLLEIYNANNGTLMKTYKHFEGAGAYSPWAFRTNPDFPLAIALVLVRDGNNIESASNYGYRVDELGYSDDNGNLIRVSNPIIQTAYGTNMGYNDGLAGQMQSTFVFQPADPPEGGSVTGWKIVFSANVDLVDKIGDTDVITLLKYSPLSPGMPLKFVSELNSNYGSPGFYSIDELKGLEIDMGSYDWLEITSEFDNQNSFWGSRVDQGWSIARIEVDYDNAIALDMTKPRLRSSAITRAEVAGAIASVDKLEYPSFGSTPDSIGEWWVTSKDHSQILLHFNLDNFRLEAGDEIQILNEAGQIIKTLRPEGGGDSDFQPGGPIDFSDPDGGGPINFNIDPNPPAELIETSGWVIIPSESAQIILVGDGGSNVGYSGFDLDRVAFWSPILAVRNELGDFSDDETSDYSRRHSDSAKQYFQY